MAYFPARQPLAARYAGYLQPRQQRQMDWFALLQLHEGRQTGHLCVGATRRVAPTNHQSFIIGFLFLPAELL